MTRVRRQVSESGFYHAMMRGAGRQLLFEDDGDRRAFLELLRQKLPPDGIEVIAWCLMDNHVHLLLHDPLLMLSHAMHGVATSYAQRFNSKAAHVGPVFQGRFRSVAVTDDPQLLEAVRYIHDNPVKAGIAPNAAAYRWSSYHEYVGGGGLASTGLVLGMLGGLRAFEDFSGRPGEGIYHFSDGVRIPQEDEAELARDVLGDVPLAGVKALPRANRNDCLRRLHEVGLSLRQIERLTGVGIAAIRRACA